MFLNTLISESGPGQGLSFLKDKLVGRWFGQRECLHILLLQVHHHPNVVIKKPFRLFFHAFFTGGMTIGST